MYDDTTYLKDTDGHVYAVRPIDASDFENPLESDQLVVGYTWHARYASPTKNPYATPSDFFRAVVETLPLDMRPAFDAEDPDLETLYEHAPVLPIYILDHSGVTYATTPFNDPWDSGHIGWLWCPTNEWDDYVDHFDNRACALDAWRRIAKAMLSEYDLWAQGSAFEVRDAEDDTCCTIAEDDIDALMRIHGVQGERLGDIDGERLMTAAKPTPMRTTTDVVSLWLREAPAHVHVLEHIATSVCTLHDQARTTLAAAYLQGYLEDKGLLETLAADLVQELAQTKEVSDTDIVNALVDNAIEHASADIDYFAPEFCERAEADFHLRHS